MKFVRPKVEIIAKSTIINENARNWLDGLGATGYELEDHVSPAEQITQLAGKRCYMSFELGLNSNIQRIRTDMSAFIDNILKVGHGSVLEHVTFTFAIENVSRVFTGEMNRHRAGTAISEGSMRFIPFHDIPICEVPSLRNLEPGDPLRSFDDLIMNEKITATRSIIRKGTQAIEYAYSALQEIWAEELAPESKFSRKKQITSMLRRIIPMGVATGGLWTLNLRALRHVFTMRCAESAEEEIMEVATMMLKLMSITEPLFFKDFELVSGFWKPRYVKV